jgi:hypothetical protein
VHQKRTQLTWSNKSPIKPYTKKHAIKISQILNHSIRKVKELKGLYNNKLAWKQVVIKCFLKYLGSKVLEILVDKELTLKLSII